MLKEDRIPALCRVEKAHAKQPLAHDHYERQSNEPGGGQSDDICGQHTPGKDGHTKQSHARRAHNQDRGDEVDRAQDRGQTHEEDGHKAELHVQRCNGAQGG